MTKAKIGFIGLGLMGGAMVGRLQDKGYSLTVLGNRNRTYLDAAIARGAVEAANAKAVAEAADVIMLCMDTSASVEGRMRGPDGVLAGLSAGKTVIDFGTSLPGSTQVLAGESAGKGAHYLDAPLGRTPAHAKDGLLNIMGAGDAEAFEAVRPILGDLGENIFHLGASGAGHTLKLFNNFIAMTTASALSEAFAMADRAGVDRQSLFDVMGAGPLRSGMMEFIRNYAVEGKIDLAFSVSNAAKDIGYYTQMAEGLGAPSIMGQCAKSALEMAKANGHGEKMVPEMIDILADHFAKNA